MFHFDNYSVNSRYSDDSNKLGVGKMRDETAAVAVEEFVELKQKMYSFLIVSIKKQKVWIKVLLQQ